MRSFYFFVVAALLLAFGVASGSETGAVSGSVSSGVSGAVSSSASNANQDSTATDRVVVTYFHRTFRCETCLAFEAYSEEALRTAFPEELADGRLVWSALNLDDEANAHYEDEYQLADLSLVVAVEHDGKVVDWRTLPDIWGLVDDKKAFVDYVTYEVGKSLEKLEGSSVKTRGKN